MSPGSGESCAWPAAADSKTQAESHGDRRATRLFRSVSARLASEDAIPVILYPKITALQRRARALWTAIAPAGSVGGGPRASAPEDDGLERGVARARLVSSL
jgi:hypothetical protein